MMKRIGQIFILLAICSGSLNSFSQPGKIQQAPQAMSRTKSPLLTPEQHQKLQRSFIRYQIITVPVADLYVLSQEKKNEIFIQLSNGSQNLNLVLFQNEIRSPDYKQERTTDQGRITIPREPCATYAGYVESDPESMVRLSLRPNYISGFIRYQGQTYYYQPLRKFLPESGEQEILVYTEKDVQPKEGVCGGGTLAEEIHQKQQEIRFRIEKKSANDRSSGDLLPKPDQVTKTPGVNSNLVMLSVAATNCRKLEIATDSDYENYNSTLGLQVTNSEIIDNLNAAEGVIQPQFQIKLVVRYQHEWNTAYDPYTTNLVCSTSDRLAEFKNYWNLNFYMIPRDLTILYSGINFDGAVVGCAYTSTIESSSFAQNALETYMIIQTNEYILGVPWNWSTSYFTSLAGHEIGHILGSQHDDSTPNIMASALSSSTNWVTSSINTINTKLANINAKNRLSRREIINDGNIAPGLFNGGEVYIYSNISNSAATLSIEGVDFCEAKQGCTLSASPGGGITVKTAPCNNSGY